MKLRELRIDGYKNLVRCKIPLSDFNVVVGPNNSGKSNLLEAFRTLWCLCFSGEDQRRSLFSGRPFLRGDAPRAVFLPSPLQAYLRIGVTFETEVKGVTWLVDFDAAVHRETHPPSAVAGFESETLKAKQPSKTGPATAYVRRDGKTLTVIGKDHPISTGTSAISAIPVLYPEPETIPPELAVFLSDVHSIARTTTFALSPEAIRGNLYKDNIPGESRVSSFGLLVTIDEVFKDKEKATLFRETVCDILELSELHFQALDVPIPKSKPDQPASIQRLRFCVIRRKTGNFSDIAEYSDGTLIVTALIAGLVLQDKTTGLTCIEELENCLHPRAQGKLLAFLKDNSSRWQLIITTHSPYIVNGIDPMDVLVAQPDEHGGTHFVKPQDRKAIDNLLKKGHMSFGDLMVDNLQDVVKAQ